MDEQKPVGRNIDYAKDIEEMHYGGTTSEDDDDDEPRLRIDTSEDEQDSPLDNSSSSFSKRKLSSTSRLKTNAGSRSAHPIKKFGAKNTNPLQSLQQLVHSPFLSTQISAADGGLNQGCKINPLAKENRSKLNCDSQSLAAAAEALRNIFSNSHNANGGGISNMSVNNWDALPTPRPNSGSGAKSKKSSSSIAAAKRNSTNYQRLSPVSIEVEPSLSHLLPLSQHSPPSPPIPQQPAFAQKFDSSSAGGRSKATNSNRLNYIVSKLQRSATEEEHLRQLQQLQSSPEGENFKMFQQFLKSGHFQTRCNNNNLEILPAAPTATPNTINLTNSKGFRYASSNAQTKPTFSFQTTSLPPPPPLTFQSAPEFHNPTNRTDFRMPPTLTMIPKSTGNGNSGKKTNCRRSPPPMVPIESIANFRKPLNEDNVVYRLKKLGTDIELEKSTAALRDDSAAAVIEDVAVKAVPASVTNNTSSNVSDKACLPFLKPIPIGERSPNDLRNLAKLHPPPPSLIPIKPVVQFIPSMPNLPQSTISEVPIKMKKNSKGRVPTFVSILPKVNVNQNDVLDMAAKIRMNSGDIVDSSQFMFSKGPPSDVIFSRKEDMLSGLNQSNIDFSHLRLPPTKVTKRKKRNRLSTKSEYTKLAHALVQAATPLPKKDDVDRPVIVPIRNEMPPKELDFNNVEGEIITIEPILMPPSRRESEEFFVNDPTSDHEDEFVHVPDNFSSPPESSPATLPPSTLPTSSASDDKGYFLFSPTQAIQVGVLPNGRKMLSCDICSGVYHKMFSLKKHYYRNHINPKFISAKHADMFKVSPISSSLAANPKSNQSTYWCSICECLFDEKAELSSHLTDHPPLTLENASKSNKGLYMCPTCNTVFSRKRTQERHSKKCAKLFQTAGISAPIAPAKESTTEVARSDDETQEDHAAEETNSTASSKNEETLEVDEIPSSSRNSSKLETSMMCLFCELSFTDTTKRKKHVLQHHHPKRKQQPCVYCKNKTFSDLSDLLKHICEMHSKRYFGCAICKIRFRTKEDLIAHNAESHDGGVIPDANKEPIVEEKVNKVATISNKNGKNYKCNQCPKVFINTVELGRHRKAAHRESSRNNVKKVVSAFSASADNTEQKYRSTIITTADYETEFYRNVCHNVKYNLEYCMEGRIEMKKEENPPQEEYDSRYTSLPGGIGIGKEKSDSLSFQDLYGTENIDSRFIQNVSRLHLETQLTMLRKANLLDKELDCPLRTKTSTVGRNSSIASHLALAEKSDGERADDEAKNENDGANEIVFTGEWIRARNYICGTCFARFNNFWDMEDHRWSRHPNVYGFYYEFVTEQTPGKNWAMKRSLQNHGSLGLTTNHNLPLSSTCTKCQKSFSPVSEFHKHILECGGDTTWMSMMFAPHTKRNKKWRPYGSRRRKNIARHRGLKRNIPTTPVKIIGPPRNRQKAGDTETIQRMIANLPPKRITRRVITFDDLDAKPKGRPTNNPSSQSNILTRKRKESMEIKNSTALRSQVQQQQQQQQQYQDSLQNVTTSKTLLGTKNNTPYNSNRTVSTSKNQTKQTATNTTSVEESTPVREETKRSEIVSEISSASSSTTTSKNKTVDPEIKEEIVAEPEISTIKISTSKGGKTVKISHAKDVENIAIKSPASVTTSSQSESDTNTRFKSTERDAVTESKSLLKTSSTGEEVTSTVVKTTTSWKSPISSGESVSIRKLRSSDESSIEKVESASESKTNQSCEERTEPVSIRKLRSSDESSIEKVESASESKTNQSRDEQTEPVSIRKSRSTDESSIEKVESTSESKTNQSCDERTEPVSIRKLRSTDESSIEKVESASESKTNQSCDERTEPVSIRKLRSTDESSVEKMEPASESKTNSSFNERTANNITNTEPKSNAEISSTLKLRSGSGSRNKSLVLQVQKDGKQKNKPVTIIRSDKKRKKRCTPITSKRLAAEIPKPPPVTTEQTESLSKSCEKSVAETIPELKTEKAEDLPNVVEKSKPEMAQVSTSEPEDLQVAPEKSTSETESTVSTEISPKDPPEMPEKLELETMPQLVIERPDDKPDKLEKMTSESPTVIASEKSNDSSTFEEKSTPEMPPVLVKEVNHKEVATETDTEIKTEAIKEPITSDAAVDSAVIESKTKLKTEPKGSSKKKVNATSITVDKPVTESEENEIDLSVIEPADEDGPLLPDTSVILAAMKETMRQTDAVISSMPIATNAGKKRKREESAKCKKCGVKVEPSTNNTLICESCTEAPAKKSKPASSPVSKIETNSVSVPKKISSNDDSYDKCVTATSAAPIATVAATVPVRNDKNDKSSPKWCSPKIKDTRIPFRCRKCDSIRLAPLDGSMFCDKCSRLQETVCLLCKSSYISDTNDKVCGKCMLAGSSKQKKRIVDTEAPAIVTSTVTSDKSEEKSLHCDVCENATKCICKRRTSGQLDRTSAAEVACDNCGKMWKDDENSDSSSCRVCRASKTPCKNDGTRGSEGNESIKCTDCGIVVVPISAEAAMKNLCDGCSMRRNERRSSNEIRYLDTSKTGARTGLGIQRSPSVFSGFAAADDKVRNRVDDMKVDHKEEERSGQLPAAASASSTEHKTPMKNVKLICRGCYGVFDTVSSYKYHCDNCKHRNNDKKPLLSFAKRNTKSGAESTSQTESNNGASFEILEGVQIKYVEMAGGSQSDKMEAGRETSQVPLVVYESDSSPIKKSDSSRSSKKHKRTQSSPETIMNTIESVIKSVCHDNVDPSLTFESNNDDSDDHEKTPVKDITCNTADDSSATVSVTEKSVSDENATIELQPEFKGDEDARNDDEKSPKKPSSKSKSSKKKAPRKRRPAAKKSKKSDSVAEREKTPAADEEVDKNNKSETEEKQPSKKELTEAEDELRGDEVDKQSKKSPANHIETSNDSKRKRNRRRACTTAVPVGRALRSRTRYETEVELEPMDVDQTPSASSLPPEDTEKPAPTIPKTAGRKRKNESNKNDAKKSKTESNNDLGFAVTKTNKTIPKNAKKNSSNDSKNFEQLDDEVESSSSANQTVPTNERTIVTRKSSSASESSLTTAGNTAPVAAIPLESAKRRRSSEISINDPASKLSSPSGTRRDSTATVISFTGELQSELAPSFFDEGQRMESSSEYADGTSSKNATPTYGFDEINGSSLPEPYDSTEGTSQNSSPSYANAWDFFGQKSLGSIIDTMNEILSRPEVSSCSSETVELFREEMMMFQHFGRAISAIDKQEEESNQDEETTTIIDLDEISSKTNKAKSKTESESTCLNTNTFNEECEICDQTFSEPNAALNHMTTAHNIESTSKDFKDSKIKQNYKSNQNGMKTNAKHKCSHCQKVLFTQPEIVAHMKEHWKSFISNKNSDNSSHLKNSIADKLEELLLDKALMNYLKSPQETQHRNNLPLKILNQISLAKKTQFTNWKSALAQMLDMDTANSPPPTTASDPASPVEPPPAAVESKPEEKTKPQSADTSNPDQLDGYPCPMCNKTFQYTRLRNTHLIMVHAPRQSTHKHLMEGKNNSKKGEKNKSSNENRDSNVRSSSTRGKVIQSYLLNDSVNTVKKSDSQDDSSLPAKTSCPASTTSSTAVASSKDSKKQEKRTVASKSTSPATTVTSTSSSILTTTSSKPNPSANAPATPSSNSTDQSNASKKKKPCRKKMSKKEMNLPAAVVKLKAEQALLQLCNSRFNRICSQT